MAWLQQNFKTLHFETETLELPQLSTSTQNYSTEVDFEELWHTNLCLHIADFEKKEPEKLKEESYPSQVANLTCLE